jgi:hypothetical protein
MKQWSLALIVILSVGSGCSGCDDEASSGGLPGIGEACADGDLCDNGLICYAGVCAVDDDNDGVPNEFDNCVDVPNPDQADTDGDGQGDACEPAVVDDNDGDNITDTQDNCPSVANPGQIDTDGDGQGDDCDDDDDDDGVLDTTDNCPLVANPDQANRNADDTGDVCSDPDGDNITDDLDNCPDVSNPNQSDLDTDGIGDVCDSDRDGDMVNNPLDNCPDVPNPAQEDTDEDGDGDACDNDTTRREMRPFDTNCLYRPPVGVFAPSLEWSLGFSAADPYPNQNQVMMTPVVVNLTDDDADGMIGTRDTPDIVYASFSTKVQTSHDELRRGVLRAASGDGAGLLWSVGSTELGLSATGGVQPAGSVAAGDIDGDGKVEIITGLWDDASETGGLVAINNDGTVLWTSSYDIAGVKQPRQFKYWWGGPSIADLDADGTPEIILGAVVFSHTGGLEWDAVDTLLTGNRGEGINWPSGDPTKTLYTGPLSVVADLDGVDDPILNRKTLEVVTGRTAYRHDGAVLWEADAALPDGFPAIGDFDGDGKPEVVVSANGTVRIHNGQTGAVVWGPVNLAAGRIGAPTIADFTGDGIPEIGVAGRSAYFALQVDLAVPTPTKVQAVLWSHATQDSSSSMTGSSVFDFEGDGRAEVVYNDELFLRVFDGVTGDVLYEQPNTSYTALENPVIADVDNDGAAEIIVGTNDFECGDVLMSCNKGFTGIRVFGDANDNWVTTRRIWNQHAYHINNINEDGTVPQSEAASWTDHNTYRLNQQTELNPQAAPDLIIEEPQADLDGCLAVIRVWVTNAGAARVGAGIPVSFYADAQANALPIYLGQAVTRLPLEPGDSERVELRVTVPAGGPYTFVAVADDLMGAGGVGTQNECKEDNNSLDVGTQGVCTP